VFESLVRLDGNQKAVPLLAESWEGSDDGLVWTILFKRKYLLARWYTFFSGRRGIYGKRYNECGGKTVRTRHVLKMWKAFLLKTAGHLRCF